MSIISLYEKSENLFFVGGIVRDELLEKSSPDIDLTFVGDAVDFFKNLEFEITQTNEEFGSVHLKIDDKTIDITSTRTETYPNKGQLPVVEKIGCTLEEDVKRRDFTVNAIAKNCKFGEIVDYVGGIQDLKNKKLRILHDKSFIDDYDDEKGSSIIQCVLNLARMLKLPVIAEGVETKEQYLYLKNSGCEVIQGFYFSKPIPTEEFLKIIAG